LRTAIGGEGLFVVGEDWTWSFVITHEERSMGIGPFLVDSVTQQQAFLR
jgi:hypothetical protein